MKTINQKYSLLKEGKESKQEFLKQAKREFPQIISNITSFEDTVSILKSKNIINENYVDLNPIMGWESTKKESWENSFSKFLSEEKELETNHIPNKQEQTSFSVHQIHTGMSVEFEDLKNLDKTEDQIEEIVMKNLKKDPLYYVKNHAFGINGLKSQDMECGEPSKGKHKSSGYGDLDKDTKKLVSEGIHDRDITSASHTNISDPKTPPNYERDRAQRILYNHRYRDEITPLLNKYKIKIQDFRKMAEVDNLSPKELLDLDYLEDRISTHLSLREGGDNNLNESYNMRNKNKFGLNTTLMNLITESMGEEDSLRSELMQIGTPEEVDAYMKMLSTDDEGEFLDFEIDDHVENFLYMTDAEDVDDIREDMGEEDSLRSELMRIGTPEEVDTYMKMISTDDEGEFLDFDIDDHIENFRYMMDAEDVGDVYEERFVPHVELHENKKFFKSLTKLGEQASLSAQIGYLQEEIDSKQEKLNSISENENLASFIDKKQIKAMEKEVAVLEKTKAKLQKSLDRLNKQTGTKSTPKQQITDDNPSDLEENIEEDTLVDDGFTEGISDENVGDNMTQDMLEQTLDNGIDDLQESKNTKIDFLSHIRYPELEDRILFENITKLSSEGVHILYKKYIING